MDSNGRQRTSSNSHVSLPSSSTFRRLPTLGRSPFRRDKTTSPSPDVNKTTGQEPSTHQRVSTFPSLSRVLGDETSASGLFLTPASTPVPNSSGHLGDVDEGDGGTGSHMLPPSRTSSLSQTPSSQPTNDPLSPLSPTDQLQTYPSKPATRDAMTPPNPLPLPSFPSPSPSDLEPITYPSHLAQTKPREAPATTPVNLVRPNTRQRDLTMGSGATILLGAVHSPSERGEPGSGGPPTGVPRRKESIAPLHENGEVHEDFEDARAKSLGRGYIDGPSGYSLSQEIQSSGRVASKGKDIDTDSVGDTVIRRRRGTRSSAYATAFDDRGELTSHRERERSRRTDSKAPRVPLRIVEPLLSPAKGIPRAPASAMYFSPLPFHGRPPGQALRAHTGTLVGDRIWCIGGVDSKTCWRGVAWFDTESLLWATIETFGEQLPPLRAHTTTLVGSRLYVFGGGDGPTYSNDVWVFDIATHRFSRGAIPSSRALPPPRRAHTTILYRNFLVVYGGGNGQAALNDVWALDVSDPDRLNWHEWRTRGDVPQKKGYHTANLIGDKMIVYGGSDGHASFADLHVLNLQTLVWTLVSTDVKHNRLSHSSTQVGSYLFILGGHNGQTYAQDVLLFNLVTLQWESKTPRGVAPPGRGYHVALLHDARIFISGGYNGVSVFEDLWVLDLSACAYLPQVTTFEVDETADQS